MSVHADILLAAGSALGAAAAIAQSRHGLPLGIRLALTRATPRFPGRVRLYRCAMCLGFWLALPGCLAWAILALDPRPLAAPLLASAFAWAVIRLSSHGARHAGP